MIDTVLYSDPACPWAYSEAPALRVIEWRYADQLDWRLVLIGLTEDASQYESRGYTPLRGALGQTLFRGRYGMPFAPSPKARLSATARACRAVIAARIDDPGSEWRVFRAIQLANFTTPLILDDDEQLAQALSRVPGLEAEAIVSRIDDPDVLETYEQDKLQSRSAAGSAAELQGKTRVTDGPVRFTAPSVTFELADTRLVAGGFQPVEAYDILVANLDPTLDRQEPPETPAPLLDYFPDGLTTQEVAALLAQNNESPDRDQAEAALLELVASGEAVRHPLGNDALWLRPGDGESQPAGVGSAQASSNRNGSDSSP
jgi:predicted DsbA family dithiol-disulfide isomerase